MTDRALPQNLDAERSVLGAVLLDNDLYAVAAGIVRAEDFFREGHRRVFRAYGRLDEARQPMDFVTLREELARAGDLEEAGGPAYLSGLIDGVPRAVNVEGYARIVRDHARLRYLIAQARVTVEEAFSGDEVDEVIARAEGRLLSLARGSERDGFVFAEDWMREALRTIERHTVERRAVTGLPTSLPALDRMTRGLQPGNLILIGARTAVGKTSLALQMALEASRHVLTAFLSLEMSREELSYRAVSLESRIDAVRIMTGHVSPREVVAIGEATSRIGERRLAIKDSGEQSVVGLCADLRRLATTHGLGAAFVDYVQLVDGPKRENRTQEVSAISKALKRLAMELRIPVVALAQLSRDAAKANDRPQLHHLKESGSLEQDANVVLLLHRPRVVEDGSARYEDGEEAELIVAKQRSGPTGVIKLQWRASLTRFADVAPEAPEAEQPTLAGAR